MITFTKQYEIISKIWQTFKNNKISEKVRINKEDLEYAKIHYRPLRFENYTLENFTSIVVFILYRDNPISKTDFLSMINNTNKQDLLDALKFRNKIINFKKTYQEDSFVIKRLTDKETNVYLSFKRGEISVIGFYVFYTDRQLVGRVLKKDFKRVSTLLQLFNIDISKIQEII